MKNAVQNNPRQSIATFRLAAPPMVWLAKAVVLWAAAFALLAAPSAFAASGNWNVDAAGNWNDTTKWSPAAVPGTAAGDVVGLTFDITAARIVTLNVAATVGTLNIGDPTTGFFAYTLSGASILTFNNSGGDASLVQATVGGANDTISTPITLADNLTVNNADGLTISGLISGAGKSLTKSTGTGTLTLTTAVNTYTGGTTNNAGTLALSKGGGSGSIRGALTINAGATVSCVAGDAIGFNADGTQCSPINIVGGTLTTDIVRNEGFATTFNLTGGTMSGAAYQCNGSASAINSLASSTVSTISGNVDLRGAGLTITTATGSVSSNVDLNISGAIVDTGNGFFKAGPGTLLLSGANTYSGANGITNSAGTLILGNTTALGASAAKLTMSGGNLDSAIANLVIANNNPQTWSSDFTFVGSQNLNLGTGAVTLGATRQVTVTAGTLTVGGVIGGSGFGLTKAGNGTLKLSGASTYSGATTINAGTLAMSSGGSIANSTITIGSSGTFDVSAAPFTLGASQTLRGSNVVNGNLTMPGTTTSAIVPGTVGTVSTLTFNNNLNMNVGGAAYFDLSTIFNGVNDQVVVAGTLTLNSMDSIHINALSGAANLDQTADYALFSDGSAPTITALPTLVWDGTTPANFGHYMLQLSGNNVVLHYNAAVGPSVTASVNPSSVTRNQPVTITATVTPGDSPTINSVTASLTSIGGSATASLVLSDIANVYTNTFLVGAGTAAGSQLIGVTATDANSISSAGSASLTVTAANQTWYGGSATDDNWSSNPNWVSGAGPGLSGDGVAFAGATRLTPKVDASYSVTGLTFNSGASGFNIGTANSSTLTLAGGVTNNSTTPQTLSVPIAVSAAQTFNAASGNLTNSGSISGAGGLTKAGVSNLTVSGSDTYTGPTVVSAGTLSRSDTGGSPASTATVTVGATASATMNILAGANVTNFNLAIGGGASGKGAVYQSGGVMTLGATATANTAEAFVIGGPVTAVAAGGQYGYYNLSGGTMNANALTMHQANNGGTAGFCVADITGGNLNITNYIAIARSGNGGWNDASSFNVLGGTVTAASILQGNSFVSDVFTVGGGGSVANVTTTASTTLGYDMDSSNANSGNNTPPNMGNLLANGTLQVGIVTATVANRNTSTFFNFNGGTLKATSPNAGANFLNSANITAVTVYSGGGTIDNNGTAITIGKPLLAPANSGVTGGTLTKGSGYIGAPLVQFTGGTLGVANKIATAIAIMEDDGTGNGTYRVASILITSPGMYSAAPTAVTFNGGAPTTAATFTSLTSAANTSGSMTFAGAGGTTTLTAASTYTNTTTISSGTLALGVGGSIANSASISVGSGAFFDVSAVSPFTLGASQTLKGSGTVSGSVTTSAGVNSIISPGFSAGTLTITNNLNMSAGGAVYFDLSTSASSGNDQIVVGGNLTLTSSDTIHINALSGAANLDSSADYVLFSVSGTTTMTTTPTLVWDGTTPANYLNYSLLKSGNNVVLHFNATPTVGTTVFSPASPVYAGTPVTLSAPVAGGTPGYTYKWQAGSDNSTWTNIPSATSSTYALDTTGQGGTTIYYRLVVTDSALQVGNGTGAALTVNAASAPIITGLTITPSTVTQGSNVNMTATYNGTLPITSYQWQHSPDNTTWASISGATSSSNVISSAQATNAGYYRVIAGNSVGFTTSSSATLAVRTILINPTTLNGSFENNSSKTTFVSGLVPNWVVWTGVSTADNDSGSDVSGAATQGTRDAYLQGGNADYDLTSYTIRAEDVFTYTWDWALAGRGPATAQLGYWNGSAVVAIAGTDTSHGNGGAQQLGLGTTWTVPGGDPSIGHQIAMTILAPSGANYPEVDNFVLTVISTPNPLTITANPVSVIVSPGSSTNFSVAATTDGTITGYQWYVGPSGSGTLITEGSTDGAGTTFNNVTSATLNLVNVGLGDSGNTYYCAVTSDYSGGTTLNSTAATLHVVATNPTNITFSVSGSSLSLSWPADHLGWYAQSNAVSVADSSAWFDIPGSQNGTNLNITIDPTKNVFFRLRYTLP